MHYVYIFVENQSGHIIFFDGVCNLCNSSVNFIITHDTRDVFRFASLQSDAARDILGLHYPGKDRLDTILYYDNGQIYDRSTAVLRIAKKLRFPFPLAYIFMIIPPFLRNYIYGVISKNRYRWFGKRDQCMVPSAPLKNKFIDSSL